MIDVFRIGVLLNMQSNAHGVLNLLSRDFLGLHGHISRAQAAMTSFKFAIGGLAGVTVGTAMIRGFADLYRHGEELVHQQALLQASIAKTRDAMGRQLPPTAIAAMVQGATDTAWQTSLSVRGTSVADNLAALNDMRQVAGGIEEAKQLLGPFQKNAAILKDIGGRISQAGGGAAFLTANFMELRGSLFRDGKFDLDEAKSELDMLTKAEVNTGGRLDPQKYLTYIKQARASGITLSDEALFEDIPALILSMGGNRFGTAQMTAWQSIVGGHMSEAAARQAYKYGLIDRPPEGKMGGSLGTSFVGQEDYQTSPILYFDKYLAPILKDLSETDAMKFLGQTFTNRNAAGMFQEIYANRSNIAKEKANIQSAAGMDETKKILDQGDPKQALTNFTTAWSNFMTALGSSNVSAGIDILNMATASLEHLTKFIVANPTIGRIGGDLMLIAGGLLILGGAMAITYAAIVPLRAAVAGLSGALGLSGLAGGAASAAGAVRSILGPLSALVGISWGLKAAADGVGNALERGIVGDENMRRNQILKQRGKDKFWGLFGIGPGAHTQSPEEEMGISPHNPIDGPRLAAPQAYRPSSGSGNYKELINNISIHLDGEIIAKKVTKRQVRDLQGPLAGPDSFDGTRHLLAV